MVCSRYLYLLVGAGLAGWKGTGPCMETVLFMSGEKNNTAQQRLSVKCVVLVLCARNRHDGWLIAGCGSDDGTPSCSSLLMLLFVVCCLMRALMATPDLMCAFFFLLVFFYLFMETDITCFVFSLETVSWPSTAFIPSGSGRSRRHGAWRQQHDGTAWPALSLSGCGWHSVAPLAKRAGKIKPVQRERKMKTLGMKVEWEETKVTLRSQGSK